MMKNSKKLLLLLLSVMLLIGTFAVASAASTSVLTIEYADGTVQTYAEGETVEPIAVPADYAAIVDGTAYKFTVAEGAAWTYSEALPETVTSADLGKTITATVDGTLGTEQVYFTVAVTDGATSYYTDAAALRTYLADMDIHGSAITLYADISMAPLTVRNARAESTAENKALSEGAKHNFDLNGHTLTFTGSGKAMVIQTDIYIYSSKPNGKIDASSHTLFNTDNDEYKCVNGTVTKSSENGYGTIDAIKINPAADVVLGEPFGVTNTYGDNLTVVCSQINSKMYGSSAYLRGGTYVQSESSTASYFLLMSRPDADYFIVGDVENVTLVTTRPGTAPLFYRPQSTSARTFTNCNFISTAEECVPLSAWATPSSAGTFNGCNFHNVLPFFPENGKAFTYTDCRFGTSNTVPGTDLDPTDGEVYLSYVKDGSAITANGETYVMNLSYETAKTDLKTVTWQDGTISLYKAETLDDAKTIVGAIPMANASTAPYAFSKDGLMYYVAEPNITGTYDETTLNAVFTDAAKENAAQVYYTVEQNGVITAYETVEANLAAFLNGLPTTGAKIVLRSDVSMIATRILGKSSGTYYLDINGFTLKITSIKDAREGAAFNVSCPSFFIYSSVDGGVIDASIADCFLWTNDTESAYSGEKYSGWAYVGEANSEGTTGYGKNLTVLCKRVAPNYFSGSGASFLGGTFVQTGAAEYFITFSQRVKAMKNTTFVLTSPSSTMMTSYALTYTNCTFVLQNDGLTSIAAADSTTALTFKNCDFINVLPVYPAGVTMTYDGDCGFGTTGFFPYESLNGAGTAYLVHAGTSVNVEANGVIYAVDGLLVTALDGYKLVTWKDEAGVLGVEYWADGATVTVPAGLKRIDTENECVWLDPSATAAADGNGITATVTWKTKDSWAFSYTNGSVTLYVYMSDCGNTTIGVGDKFYELFSVPASAYTITLYQDMTLTKAMGFGPLIASASGGYNRDYYDSLVNGNIALDLNGKTLTIDSTLVGINLASANFAEATPTVQNAYKPAVFALECRDGRVFTLKSSASGAEIINDSTASLFGIGEGAHGKFNIENADNNITVRTKGQLFGAVESYSSQSLNLNGGTYIYEGSDVIATVSQKVVLENATFICTQNVAAILRVDGYRPNNLTATNCVFYSPNNAKLMVKGAGNSSSIASASASSPFVFDNCDFVNVTLTEKITVNYKVSDVATDFHAYVTYVSPLVSTDADLALGYAGADLTDLVKAYASVSVNGTIYKLMGYYAQSAVGTVDWGFDLDTELWALGSIATRENALIAETFIYAFNPTAVDAETVNATYYITGVESGKLQMNLTLQSEIGVNLLIAEALSGATVTLGDEAEAILAGLTAADGYYTLTTVLAPTEANAKIAVKVVLDGMTHTFSLSIESYATTILTSEAYADAHNLTFAMVKYVQAMTEDESFCESLSAPEGYEDKTLASTPYEKADGNVLLSGIAFQLDKNIAVAVAGEKGTEVVLTMKNGRTETATIGTNGEAIFECLYVNEFFGTLTITAGTETYTYSLENYLNAMEPDHPEKVPAIKALYTYTYYADDYVENVVNQAQ